MESVVNQEVKPFDIRIDIKSVPSKPLSVIRVWLIDSDDKLLYGMSFDLLPRVPLETYVSTVVGIFNSKNHETKDS